MTKGLNIRLGDDDHEAWKEAAARQGVSLSEFVRVSVDRALELERVGGRIVKPESTTSAGGVPLHTPASAAASKAQRAKPGRNRQTVARATRAAVCPRQRHHRAGVYCRECGTTP